MFLQLFALFPETYIVFFVILRNRTWKFYPPVFFKTKYEVLDFLCELCTIKNYGFCTNERS